MFREFRLLSLASVALGLSLPNIISPSPGIPSSPGSRRGKRKQAKPKKRPNRLTISKRVRRKHRRAA